ncbi:biogenesis of lysosome-related organelles complex 1 subunit 1 isoform X2 [Temnothorax curvispinosus]|uniref:Biogenesis of lysosome-related organelles complex 1 subunit 1 isoform X2 n=1 Tax=Temnothorax curvispinosus TaxID=300111 RepID=A0A6J1PWU1_9HYME|nr:biogenesis of lysosome-related organelles complex 1 subunit 1 isoform X2 [Temnothorax curvispinosus]
MLSAIVKEHQSKQSARKERQEQKRKDAVQAASNLTQALVDHLNVGSSVSESEETRRRSEAAAAQRDQFCQANAVVVEFGGVLLELLERDRRRGKLGAQHRGRHENDSDRFGIFVQSHTRESKCR